MCSAFPAHRLVPRAHPSYLTARMNGRRIRIEQARAGNAGLRCCLLGKLSGAGSYSGRLIVFSRTSSQDVKSRPRPGPRRPRPGRTGHGRGRTGQGPGDPGAGARPPGQGAVHAAGQERPADRQPGCAAGPVVGRAADRAGRGGRAGADRPQGLVRHGRHRAPDPAGAAPEPPPLAGHRGRGRDRVGGRRRGHPAPRPARQPVQRRAPATRRRRYPRPATRRAATSGPTRRRPT